ncbi:unnamed protein product [Pleuronectes platessa]|uniref:Uncharacterized protein n=1 Tax=Pleuronectes platessa TaxID=8262 RepID=A0A9N7Y6B6_PLEPL|nr:unnamed protein product [Pleuronectes platessa]
MTLFEHSGLPESPPPFLLAGPRMDVSVGIETSGRQEWMTLESRYLLVRTTFPETHKVLELPTSFKPRFVFLFAAAGPPSRCSSSLVPPGRMWASSLSGQEGKLVPQAILAVGGRLFAMGAVQSCPTWSARDLYSQASLLLGTIPCAGKRGVNIGEKKQLMKRERNKSLKSEEWVLVLGAMSSMDVSGTVIDR